jgi:peptidoglycan/LPS O-acetylase OafA/YrhL
VAAVFALSAALGLASWHLVEKQALALKSRFSGKSPAGAVAGNPTEA